LICLRLVTAASIAISELEENLTVAENSIDAPNKEKSVD
jgi:hypothetical protein